MSMRVVSIAALVLMVLGPASVSFGAEEGGGEGFVLLKDVGAAKLGGSIGAGLVLFAGAVGISRIAVAACENIARQPEAGGRIFTSMIITAAMIEGATFFGVVVCLLSVVLEI